MTNTADAIVTELNDGPATARDLSQRLDGIGYANIRQTLRRLSARGAVTKLRRGLYAVDCDTGAHPETAKGAANDNLSSADHQPKKGVEQIPEVLPEPVKASRELTMAQVNAALALVWADFHAVNDPRDPGAWA